MPHTVAVKARHITLVATVAIAATGIFVYQESVLAPIDATTQKTIAAQEMAADDSTNNSSGAQLSLITEPQDGMAPIISAIENASSSVDVAMYELEDPQIESALAADEARGITVRVLLNKGYYGAQDGANLSAYRFFQIHDVPVEWTRGYFALTHQKTVIVDDATAYILSFNFTPKYYASDRDFGIIDTNTNDAGAIEQTFDADWGDTQEPVSSSDDLVWSPNSETQLLNLLNSAQKSLLIYNEEMEDPNIISALQAAAARGVSVEVLMTDDSSWHTAFEKLVQSGVQIRTYSANASLYIHAKMILADGTTAFVGSQNFSTTSLLDNRELGILFSNSAIIASLQKTFAGDWQNATPFIDTNTK